MLKYQIYEIENYAINTVKVDRIALGITQTELAECINETKNSSFVGLVESNSSKETYNIHQLQQFVNKFNSISALKTDEELELIGARRTYSLLDYLPTNAFEEKHINKEILFVPNKLKASGALFLLEEAKDTFIYEWHTVKEFVEYANLKFSQNWNSSHFSSALEYSVIQNKYEKNDTLIHFRKITSKGLNLK